MSIEPRLIIVMGVSGCGKSTIASALADHFEYQFIEADDFHSSENREHMSAGLALTDRMREPWINAMLSHLQALANAEQSCVLSFSGLKAAHRKKLKSAYKIAQTLHLEGDKELIERRMTQRKNHFMPSSLLESQYRALENPNYEPHTHSININCSINELVKRSLTALQTH